MSSARRFLLRFARRPWPRALLLVSLAFAAGFLWLEPRFQSNDDIAMMEIVSGADSGAPSAQMVYSHVFIGAVLSRLYALAPSLPWYPLHLYAAQASAWVLILLGLGRLPRAGWPALALVPVALALGGWVFQQLQFTSTAILLASAGLFYLVACGGEERRSWRPYLIAGLACLWAGMIRPRSFELAAALALPMGLAFWVRGGPRGRALLFALAVVALHGALLLVNRGLARSGGRERYAATLALVPRIVDRAPMGWAEVAELEDVGWELNDLDMLYRFYRTDAAMYAPERLEKLAALNARTRGRLELKRSRRQVRAELQGRFRDQASLIFALVLLALALRPRDAPLLLAVLLGAYYLAVAMQHYFGRLPPRVIRPAFVSLALSLLYVAASRPARLAWWRAARLTAAVLALAFALWLSAAELRGLLSAAARHRTEAAVYRADLERVAAVDPGGLFLFWGATGDRRRPLWASADELPRPRTVRMGWRAGSPAWRAKLRAYGIADLSAAIAAGRVVVVCGPEAIAPLRRYLERRYGGAPSFEARAPIWGGRGFVYRPRAPGGR